MSGKIGLQEEFLSALQRGKRPAVVIAQNGYQLRGQIAAFDQFTVLVECEGKRNLVYKSAISTIVDEGKVNLP